MEISLAISTNTNIKFQVGVIQRTRILFWFPDRMSPLTEVYIISYSILFGVALVEDRTSIKKRYDMIS